MSIDSPTDGEIPLQYRALSTGAVISLVLGLASSMTIPTGLSSLEACVLICPIPIVGLLLGWRALAGIRRQPDELTGQRLALSGIVLSFVFLVGGLGLASYVYATEVPPGYERVTFNELRPDEAQRARRNFVPEDVAPLAGQHVFIKGLIRPGSQRYGLNEFTLVRDNNECCFGAKTPEYYDRVEVRLTGNRRTDYATGLFRVGGKLSIDPSQAFPGTQGVVYRLEADYLQ